MTAVGDAGDGATGDAKSLQAHVAASFRQEPNSLTINRDGLSPLVFNGTLLAEVSGCNPGARLWYELAAYSREDGGYVAAINVFKKDMSGRDSRWARVFKSLNDVFDYFEGHDPAGDVDAGSGHAPQRVSDAETILSAASLRQRLAEARSEYEAVVSELLDALPQAA
jgi:hypothetical protein